MYAFIEGEVIEKSPNELILMAGGVGYRISCSINTLQAVPAVGETMRCYTVFSVREDAMELFGFATREEKHMFRLLTSVTGVGARTALGILGAMPLKDLNLAILMNDATALSRAPGVGKKTAQRIALELKDKISQSDIDEANAISGAPAAAAAQGDGMKEAREALIALGYSAAEAASALNAVEDKSAPADVLIKQALVAMMRM